MQEWIEILLRAILLFGLVLGAVRLMGKRQPSRMTAFQFVNYIVIAIITAFLVLNLIDTAFGIIALIVWIGLPIALDYLSIKSKLVHDMVHGKETILIKQGKIMEENLMQTRLTGEDLLRALREKNAFNAADVEFAVMETTGDINVMFKSDKKPITSHDLGRKVAPQTEPQTVVLDGNIMDEPLANMGLNRGWLKSQLEGKGISLDNVFIAQIDTVGDLYIDTFDDAMQLPMPKVKELVYTNLEKIHADLISYSQDTLNPEAKAMYMENAQKVESLKKKLEPYLMH
ncbi:DUF421 domain-containing protein [Desulfitibacter alkalitolerans]|uniref:DUF421 domain-containing protein n=1 Tax=Desulfitibacter alkalitolerans TaxID=264641 RepID=UPI0004830E75|nr:DUF421 domain-containing protein [Desulfitibacter alkalitolerans]